MIQLKEFITLLFIYIFSGNFKILVANSRKYDTKKRPTEQIYHVYNARALIRFPYSNNTFFVNCFDSQKGRNFGVQGSLNEEYLATTYF